MSEVTAAAFLKALRWVWLDNCHTRLFKSVFTFMTNALFVLRLSFATVSGSGFQVCCICWPCSSVFSQACGVWSLLVFFTLPHVSLKLLPDSLDWLTRYGTMLKINDLLSPRNDHCCLFVSCSWQEVSGSSFVGTLVEFGKVSCKETTQHQQRGKKHL